MKAVDEQLQVVIDGTMEENKKEEDIETRRYGEGFCAGIELAQRYIRNADIKLYECIVDNEGYERCSHCNEHETGMRYFTFCPRCGVKLKHYGNKVMPTLEWVTNLENMQHAVRTGLRPLGEKVPNAKFTNEQVQEIRKEYEPNVRGKGIKALAKKYGVAYSTIKNILYGRKWKYVD